MNELRWILLAAGVLLIAGIYFWGQRAKRRAAVPEPDRVTRVEPPRTVPVVAEPPRHQPETLFDESAFEEPEFPPAEEESFEDDEPAPRIVPGTVRREPRLEPQLDTGFEPTVAGSRVEPRLEEREDLLLLLGGQRSHRGTMSSSQDWLG